MEEVKQDGHNGGEESILTLSPLRFDGRSFEPELFGESLDSLSTQPSLASSVASIAMEVGKGTQAVAATSAWEDDTLNATFQTVHEMLDEHPFFTRETSQTNAIVEVSSAALNRSHLPAFSAGDSFRSQSHSQSFSHSARTPQPQQHRRNKRQSQRERAAEQRHLSRNNPHMSPPSLSAYSAVAASGPARPRASCWSEAVQIATASTSSNSNANADLSSTAILLERTDLLPSHSLLIPSGPPPSPPQSASVSHDTTPMQRPAGARWSPTQAKEAKEAKPLPFIAGVSTQSHNANAKLSISHTKSLPMTDIRPLLRNLKSRSKHKRKSAVGAVRQPPPLVPAIDPSPQPAIIRPTAPDATHSHPQEQQHRTAAQATQCEPCLVVVSTGELTKALGAETGEYSRRGGAVKRVKAKSPKQAVSLVVRAAGGPQSKGRQKFSSSSSSAAAVFASAAAVRQAKQRSSREGAKRKGAQRVASSNSLSCSPSSPLSSPSSSSSISSAAGAAGAETGLCRFVREARGGCARKCSDEYRELENRNLKERWSIRLQLEETEKVEHFPLGASERSEMKQRRAMLTKRLCWSVWRFEWAKGRLCQRLESRLGAVERLGAVKVVFLQWRKMAVQSRKAESKRVVQAGKSLTQLRCRLMLRAWTGRAKAHTARRSTVQSFKRQKAPRIKKKALGDWTSTVERGAVRARKGDAAKRYHQKVRMAQAFLAWRDWAVEQSFMDFRVRHAVARSSPGGKASRAIRDPALAGRFFRKLPLSAGEKAIDMAKVYSSLQPPKVASSPEKLAEEAATREEAAPPHRALGFNRWIETTWYPKCVLRRFFRMWKSVSVAEESSFGANNATVASQQQSVDVGAEVDLGISFNERTLETTAATASQGEGGKKRVLGERAASFSDEAASTEAALEALFGGTLEALLDSGGRKAPEKENERSFANKQAFRHILDQSNISSIGSISRERSDSESAVSTWSIRNEEATSAIKAVLGALEKSSDLISRDEALSRSVLELRENKFGDSLSLQVGPPRVKTKKKRKKSKRSKVSKLTSLTSWPKKTKAAQSVPVKGTRRAAKGSKGSRLAIVEVSPRHSSSSPRNASTASAVQIRRPWKPVWVI